MLPRYAVAYQHKYIIRKNHTSKCHDFDDFTRTGVVIAYAQLFMRKSQVSITTTTTQQHTHIKCITDNFRQFQL